MPKVYALLVGINDYPAPTGKLSGCVNDVANFQAYLTDAYPKGDLSVLLLTDAGATRAAVIEGFRKHLGQARSGDVAVFHYCGHGARSKSAPAFREFFSDGWDEGLVCVDSRLPGAFDLADKELAVLIDEVAANGPHLGVILDCCHSGSGTRDADDFMGFVDRTTGEDLRERPLESYLDGHYETLRAAGQSLYIPAGRHMLMAACSRWQTAKEDPVTKRGFFTTALADVLRKSRGDLSYADLFVRCRAAIRANVKKQEPQLEAVGGFDASSGFLGSAGSRTRAPYSVQYAGGGWTLNAGAVHGLPTDTEAPITLALYREDDPSQPAGAASVRQVGAQESMVDLAFASAQDTRYAAAITSLPVPPMLVRFDGSAEEMAAAQGAFDAEASANVLLTAAAAGAAYALARVEGDLQLLQPERDGAVWSEPITGGDVAGAARRMIAPLKRIAQWERALALQNPRTVLDASKVTFAYSERLEDGTEHAYPEGDLSLDFVKTASSLGHIHGKFRVSNQTGLNLYVALVYLSEDFGITGLYNEPLDAGAADVTIWGADPNAYFWLADGKNVSVERFKLIVSTEKVDDFLFNQDDLHTANRAMGMTNPDPAKTAVRNEWFAKDCVIKVVRRLDAVGAADATLAGGKIRIKAHPSVTAALSLDAARTPTRSVDGGSDFYRAFEQNGLSLVNFAATRGEDETILELTDIQNTASLRDNPLQIELDVPLDADQAILPVVFDGRHVMLGGEVYKALDGKTHIAIDHIPEVADNRRSLGGALKLYFFKTYLKQTDVNPLRWIEFKADGTFQHQKSGVADRVAGANSILLLVHGIIGDTANMAAGVQACGLDKQFDLVLAYDYESLNTLIGDTAGLLKAQLAAAGLGPDDGKRLTVLAHSMGGLVSRWWIEREGGAAMVDHLVMCGTPNNGSPFGRIDGARKILTMLTTVAMNYLPVVVPYGSALLMLLNRSKKLTPALEQMNPVSEFIRTLNASPDPTTPYTILAGDIEAYREPSDQFFPQMIAKVGQSVVFEAVFAQKANDIAVGVESILGVGADRPTAPIRANVACHHLNYFGSQTGQAALNAVDWRR